MSMNCSLTMDRPVTETEAERLFARRGFLNPIVKGLKTKREGCFYQTTFLVELN